MTLQRPELLAIAPVVVLIIALAIVAQWRRGVRLVDAYGGPAPAQRLTGRRLERFPSVRAGLVLIGAMALVLAAAGVEPESGEEVPPSTPIDLIIAVDVSHSMSGADVEPTRIERARMLVNRIVEEGVADRIALSLFADWPYSLVPLTDDGVVVDFFSPWIAPALMASRDQGTSLPSVIEHALATWEERARPNATPLVLIITDGEVHETETEVFESIAVAFGRGVRIWTAGVGSASGAPLFVAGSQAPLLDGSGRPVVALYDPDFLREMAQRGGGTFHDVSREAGLRGLLSDLRGAGGEIAEVGDDAPNPNAWLIMLALMLLAGEAVVDSGRRLPRLRLSPESREASV